MKKFKLGDLDREVEEQCSSSACTWLALLFQRQPTGDFSLVELALHPAKSSRLNAKHTEVCESLWGNGLKSVTIFLLVASRQARSNYRVEEDGILVEAAESDSPTTWVHACHSNVSRALGDTVNDGDSSRLTDWRASLFGLERQGRAMIGGPISDGISFVCRPRRTTEGPYRTKVLELRLPSGDEGLRPKAILVYLADRASSSFTRQSPKAVLEIARQIEAQVSTWMPRIGKEDRAEKKPVKGSDSPGEDIHEDSPSKSTQATLTSQFSTDGPSVQLMENGKRQTGPSQRFDAVIDFVGREKEIQLLVQSLLSANGPRIALIHGMPGLGKTELGLKVASAVRSSFSHEPIFLSLQTAHGGRRSNRDILADCVFALKGPTELSEEQDTLARMYRAAVANKRVLFIADNAAGADQIAVIGPPQGCSVIVTCREKLTMPEATYYLRPEELSPIEARQLLTRICPGLKDNTTSDLARLCGYLPLALRCAGTLLAVREDCDPTDFIARLSDERQRLEHLTQDEAPLSVRASFNVSYSQLPARAATVFRNLGVFPGTFDKAAAIACCDDLDGKNVSDLLKRGLVIFDQQTKRYWLHDLMRLFALEKLREAPAAEERGYRRRHADHFLSVLETADKLYGVQTEAFREGLLLFERERINILSAWQWLASEKNLAGEDIQRLSKFGRSAGFVVGRNVSISERLALFEASLRASTSLKDEPAEADCICSLSTALYNSGDDQKAREAIRLLRHAVKLKLPTKDRASVYWTLGNVYMALEPRDERNALDAHENAAKLAKQTDDIPYAIRATARLAMTCFANYQQQRARELFQQALNQASEEFKRSRLYVLNFLGQMETKLGKVKTAEPVSEEARKLAVLFGDQGAESGALVQLGRILRQREPAKALSYFERSLEINEERGNLRRMAGAYCDIGRTYRQMRNYKEALEAFSKSVRISEEINWEWNVRECKRLADEVQREMSD